MHQIHWLACTTVLKFRILFRTFFHVPEQPEQWTDIMDGNFCLIFALPKFKVRYTTDAIENIVKKFTILCR